MTDFNQSGSYDSISSSPFTVSNITCTGKVHNDLRIRANNYFIMISGYIEFVNANITLTGGAEVSMPFDTPNKVNEYSRFFPNIISYRGNGTGATSGSLNQGQTTVYSDKLIFSAYQQITTAKIPYFMYYFFGTIFKYV